MSQTKTFAPLSVMHRLGEIMTRDFKNGIALGVKGDALEILIRKDGVEFYRAALDGDQAELIAGYFAKGADMLLRQGGSGLGEAVRVAPVAVSGIIIPCATLGQVIPLGEIFFSLRPMNCLVTMIRGNLMVLRIFKDGVKFYDMEFGGKQTGKLAEFFRRGADMLGRQGGSSAAPLAPAAIST